MSSSVATWTLTCWTRVRIGLMATRSERNRLQLVIFIDAQESDLELHADGAGAGAWFGLLIGLLFTIFAVGSGVPVAVLGSVGIGAFWGSRVRLRARIWATGGDRDFSSVSQLIAKRYIVQVDARYLDEARKIAFQV